MISEEEKNKNFVYEDLVSWMARKQEFDQRSYVL